MCGEGDESARDERVGVLVLRRAEWGSSEERGEVECSQGVEDDDFVRCVGVDGLREREVGRAVVKGRVEGRVGGRILPCEARNVLVQIALSLRGGDGRAGAVVVVEGEVIVVLVVEEVFLERGQWSAVRVEKGTYLAEEVAEGRVAEGVGFIRAELQHSNSIGRGEVDALGLRLEAGDGAVDCSHRVSRYFKA